MSIGAIDFTVGETSLIKLVYCWKNDIVLLGYPVVNNHTTSRNQTRHSSSTDKRDITAYMTAYKSGLSQLSPKILHLLRGPRP